MQAVIVGCGRVGANLAVKLADEGHDVAVVDKDPASFGNLGATFNGITVTGTGIDEDVLRAAGIDGADVFAAVTSNDSVNLMAAQVAQRVFDVPRVVARANEPGRTSLFSDLGITTVCPTNIGAAAIKSMLLVEGIDIKLTVGAGEVLLADVVYGMKLEERSIREVEIPSKLRVCAIVRDGRALIPDPEATCCPGDHLIVSARLDVLEPFKVALEGNREEHVRSYRESIIRGDWLK